MNYNLCKRKAWMDEGNIKGKGRLRIRSSNRNVQANKGCCFVDWMDY
jgi:hypothetical protein